MVKKIEKFQCEYCRKLFTRRDDALLHEETEHIDVGSVAYLKYEANKPLPTMIILEYTSKESSTPKRIQYNYISRYDGRINTKDDFIKMDFCLAEEEEEEGER